MGKTLQKLIEQGTTPLAPFTHFGFCPVCRKIYQTWEESVSFKCYSCGAFIEIKKSYPKELTKIPSCRWYGKDFHAFQVL